MKPNLLGTVALVVVLLAILAAAGWYAAGAWTSIEGDRKSTRLNSSHVRNSYAVFCLKKNKAIQKLVPLSGLRRHGPLKLICAPRVIRTR